MYGVTSRTHLGMIWPALFFNLNRISLLLMTLWFPSRRKHNHTKREVKYLQALHVNLVETSAFKPCINVFSQTDGGLFMESSRHPVASFFRHPGSHNHFNVYTYLAYVTKKCTDTNFNAFCNSIKICCSREYYYYYIFCINLL